MCADTCPRECGKLAEERKLQLFREFYAVPYEKQQAIILSGLEQVRDESSVERKPHKCIVYYYTEG